jgi:hypothetical protein
MITLSMGDYIICVIIIHSSEIPIVDIARRVRNGSSGDNRRYDSYSMHLLQTFNVYRVWFRLTPISKP